MMNRRYLAVLSLLLVAACSRPADPVATTGDAVESRPTIVTSNYPLYFATTRLLEGIAGAPDVVFPTIDGDPTFWTPDPAQIELLQSADLVILNGANAEPWLDIVTLDQSRLFDTTAGLAGRLIPLEDAVQHQHGPEGEHSHQGTAFTTWLDPDLFAAQVSALSGRLALMVEGDEPHLRENQTSLESDLAALDEAFDSAFEALRGQPVLFSHPVYQYLERRYGLDGRSLHWEPDAEPSMADWIEMQEIRDRHPAGVMIWEDDPLPSVRDRLASAGIDVITFRTAANRPANGDYLDVMKANSRRINAAP